MGWSLTAVCKQFCTEQNWGLFAGGSVLTAYSCATKAKMAVKLDCKWVENTKNLTGAACVACLKHRGRVEQSSACHICCCVNGLSRFGLAHLRCVAKSCLMMPVCNVRP